MVEPVYPFQRRELDGFERAPLCSSMDELGLIEAIDRLGESVVVAIADAADRWFDAGLRQALCVLDRDVLAAAITMVNKPCAMDGPAVMEGLFQRIEHEARMCCS